MRAFLLSAYKVDRGSDYLTQDGYRVLNLTTLCY
jgi:hypothetical protein